MSSAKWMQDLNVMNKSFYELQIPGTHNSATNYINAWNPLQSEFSKYSPAYFIFPFIFTAWTKCQNLTIFEQLTFGVRYLD